LKWDIGLAPLTSNEFNLSKGPTKYRDYGACRVAGIYSDIIVYNEYVENEKTGLLVENNERSWYMAIKRLIIDVNLRNSIINNAYNDVYKNHNLSSAVEGWRQIFSNIFNKE